MKKITKILAVIIAAAMMIAPFALSSSAFCEATAQVAYGTPNAIDGKYDDGWKDAVKFDDILRDINQEAADYHVSQGWAAVVQVRANARLMWDETNLYILIEVADPTVGTLENETSDHPWLRNVVQLCFDWGDEGHNSGKEAQYDGNDCGFEIGAQGTLRHFANDAFANCYTYKTVFTEGVGYTVEIAIEYAKFASAYSFEPAEGKTMGFGFIVCDSDAWDTWHRDSLCIWGGSELMTTWPNEMGNLVFAAKPEPSTEDPGTDEPPVPTGDTFVALAAVAVVMIAGTAVVIGRKRG